MKSPVPAGAIEKHIGVVCKMGSGRTYLARLRSLELVRGARDALTMSEELAP